MTATPRETLNGSFVVAVTVENQGTATTEVPVIVRGENGESSARLQIGPKQKETTRVAVQGKPQQVIVNDGSVPELKSGGHVFKFPANTDSSSSGP